MPAKPMSATPMSAKPMPDDEPSPWRLMSDEEARLSWNTELGRLADASPFQSYEWGRYHRSLGWEPLHYVAPAADGGAVRALALVLMRRAPGRLGFGWCAGGPLGDIAAWRALPAAVRETQGLRGLYVRVRCERPRHPHDALLLRHGGWRPPAHPLGSGLSMALDLTQDPEALHDAMHRNWRRGLRHARGELLRIERTSHPDVDEIRDVFAEMEGRKRLPELFSRDRLAHLFDSAAARLVFLQCRDRDGRLVAVRGALTLGDRACDYVAATSQEGRRLRASYLVLWELLAQCRAAGVAHYDLGGIDPWLNPGVYEFKKQSGAREIEFLGEWQWATAPWLAWAGDTLVRRRGGVRATMAAWRDRLRRKAAAPGPAGLPEEAGAALPSR